VDVDRRPRLGSLNGPSKLSAGHQICPEPLPKLTRTPLPPCSRHRLLQRFVTAAIRSNGAAAGMARAALRKNAIQRNYPLTRLALRPERAQAQARSPTSLSVRQGAAAERNALPFLANESTTARFKRYKNIFRLRTSEGLTSPLTPRGRNQLDQKNRGPGGARFLANNGYHQNHLSDEGACPVIRNRKTG